MTQLSMLDHPSIAGPRKSEKDRWFARVRAELFGGLSDGRGFAAGTAEGWVGTYYTGGMRWES